MGDYGWKDKGRGRWEGKRGKEEVGEREGRGGKRKKGEGGEGGKGGMGVDPTKFWRKSTPLVSGTVWP